MSTIHRVSQGEYLASIAKRYGFADWRKIYDHPENAGFREECQDPNILLPGDRLFIPNPGEKQQSCATDQCHTFRVVEPTITLKVTLNDEERKPFNNQPYKLSVEWQNSTGALWRHYQGTTSASGGLQQEIEIGAERALLLLSQLGLSWPLKIGHLDPLHKGGADAAIISGVQARLNNLGFHCGSVDGKFGPVTQEALREFQVEVMGKELTTASGQPDRQTRDALKKMHGC